MGRRGRSLAGDQGYVFFVTSTVMNFDRIFGSGEAYYSAQNYSLGDDSLTYPATDWQLAPASVATSVGNDIRKDIKACARLVSGGNS
jgi:hypothetical protein